MLLKEHLINQASVGVKNKSIDNVKVILDWFNGKNEELKNFELGINNKWGIVKKAYRY